jgi:hypothetical protein
MAMSNGSGFATNEQTDLSMNALGDLIVVAIKTRG